MNYDLLILGGGPAGYHAAQKAADAKLSVCLIEKNDLGGVCLNEGCIPSKTLLSCSKRYRQAIDSKTFGVETNDVTFDLLIAMTKKEKVINTLKKGIIHSLKKDNITVISKNGLILEKSIDNLFRIETDKEIFAGTKLLICTGSTSIVPPITGVDMKHVLTNKEILSLKTVPKKLVIIGGGVVGLEMATFYAEIGTSVTIVEMVDTIGGSIDSEIAKLLLQSLRKKGVIIHTQTAVTEIKQNEVIAKNINGKLTIKADTVLLSVGRRAFTKGIGLKNIGLKIDQYAISTDSQCRTMVKDVFAAGDVNGLSMLAHTAYREADVVINNILGIDDTINYDSIPAVLYTHPEIATVGLTEIDAINRGVSVTVKKLPLTYNSRFLAETDKERGICKVIINKEKNSIIGIHIAGGSASELINSAALIVSQQTTLKELSKTVFAHPTVSEIIVDTALQ